MGLSPRVRGNLATAAQARPASRSIPARAGEPGWTTAATRTTTVYPRACGGTTLASLRYSDGNRSIPARAGEPDWPDQTSVPGAVYPRACGGTHGEIPAMFETEGLSPRVRGNPRSG